MSQSRVSPKKMSRAQPWLHVHTRWFNKYEKIDRIQLNMCRRAKMKTALHMNGHTNYLHNGYFGSPQIHAAWPWLGDKVDYVLGHRTVIELHVQAGETPATRLHRNMREA